MTVLTSDWRSRSASPSDVLSWLCLGSAATLVPWVAFLAWSLPGSVGTVAATAWVAFDLVLMALLAITGALALRRHHLHAVTAGACAALLVGDACVDVVTTTGPDHLVAIASAALVELPLAWFLGRHAVRTSSRARLVERRSVPRPVSQ